MGLRLVCGFTDRCIIRDTAFKMSDIKDEGITSNRFKMNNPDDYKIGTIVGIGEPEGVICGVYSKDSKRFKETIKLKCGPPIDIVFFSGKFKGCIALCQDSFTYDIFNNLKPITCIHEINKTEIDINCENCRKNIEIYYRWWYEVYHDKKWWHNFWKREKAVAGKLK